MYIHFFKIVSLSVLLAVSGVEANLGDPCAFSDGATGRCEELNDCLSNGGVARRNIWSDHKWSSHMVRCHVTGNTPDVYVCCRKPKAVAKKRKDMRS